MRALLFSLCLVIVALPAAAATVTDSRGEQTIPEPPQRVVALSWSLAEQLLELGVTPVGVADPTGYRTWVVRPDLPEGVTDVGLRREPDLEAIAALEPDLILASDDQIGFVPLLEKIAPVLHFDSFKADHDNEQAARAIFRDLGRVFGREAEAEASLKALDAKLADLRARVREHFPGAPPKVTVIRFVDDARVVIYGDNAMSTYALKALGLESGYPLPATAWGLTMRPVRDLGEITDGVVLAKTPFDKAEVLFDKPLWQAMPFVRGDRFHALPPTWSYGGAHSVGYLADAIANALLAAPAR